VCKWAGFVSDMRAFSFESRFILEFTIYAAQLSRNVNVNLQDKLQPQMDTDETQMGDIKKKK
jgi:hypothetical protein